MTKKKIKKKVKKTYWLELPEEKKLLEAAGRVAFAHAHLEYIMRLTIRTLSGMNLRTALIATKRLPANNLREVIKSLFNEKTDDKELRKKLSQLLKMAENLTTKRNHLIHRPWAVDQDGNYYSKGDQHQWDNPPTVQDLDDLAGELLELGSDFSEERRNGFIKQVCEE